MSSAFTSGTSSAIPSSDQDLLSTKPLDDSPESAAPRLSYSSPTPSYPPSRQSSPRSSPPSPQPPRYLPPSLHRPYRLLRLILGPSTPLPDSQLPSPRSWLAISIPLSSSSTRHTLNPEASLRRLIKSYHLKRLYLPFLALWLTANILLIRQQYYLPSSAQLIGCTDRVWEDWPPDTCGLNATDCADALRASNGTYRCLGGCAGARLGNSRWVGGESINGQAVIIGGNEGVFRADSWVCPSAIHAGLISPSLGGCLTVAPLPYPAGASSFLGSTSHSLTSLAFPPHFPGAITLARSSLASGCIDLHPIISTFNAVVLFLSSALLAPSPPLLFSTLLVLGYFHLTLFADPSAQPPDWSFVLGGLPAVLLAGYWIYVVSFRRTLPGFQQLPLEKASWQGLGFWIGIESSTIFAKLPITRLGYDPLDPAGVVTLTVIVVLVVGMVLVQAWQMRKHGLFQYYLLRYLPVGVIILILAFLPGYIFRPHHYLLALLALPVLSLPNRPSLALQAFMLGLFLDGVGRWGWESIIETVEALRGDAPVGTYMPEILNSTAQGMLSWLPVNATLKAQGYEGVSLLVDDVLGLSNVTQTNLTVSELGLASDVDHYFRLAYVANGSSLDWTDPVTFFVNGSWRGIL